MPFLSSAVNAGLRLGVAREPEVDDLRDRVAARFTVEEDVLGLEVADGRCCSRERSRSPPATDPMIATDSRAEGQRPRTRRSTSVSPLSSSCTMKKPTSGSSLASTTRTIEGVVEALNDRRLLLHALELLGGRHEVSLGAFHRPPVAGVLVLDLVHFSEAALPEWADHAVVADLFAVGEPRHGSASAPRGRARAGRVERPRGWSGRGRSVLGVPRSGHRAHRTLRKRVWMGNLLRSWIAPRATRVGVDPVPEGGFQGRGVRSHPIVANRSSARSDGLTAGASRSRRWLSCLRRRG